MENKIRVDYLKNHPNYKVFQHQDMYHFNTDTCLLGEFIKIKKDDKVLDVGTNNGALLLYVLYQGGKAYGIEINKQALEICKLTLKENNFEAILINEDFTNYKSGFLFDVIISNPPYFEITDMKEISNNPHKKIARHESTLTLSNLCKSIKNNLKKTGKIYLVYRPNRLKDLNQNLNDNNLFINKLVYVYNKTKKDPISILVKASFRKTKKMTISNQFID